MTARMTQPALALPGTMDALLAVGKTLDGTGLPDRTVHLVHLRASQINGCSFCTEMHAKEALDGGDTVERVVAVGAWRDSRRFTDAERAALELTEAVTRLADRPDPVADEVWDVVADHYDEKQIAALTMQIGMINLWNRLNATVRQPAGVPPRD